MANFQTQSQIAFALNADLTLVTTAYGRGRSTAQLAFDVLDKADQAAKIVGGSKKDLLMSIANVAAMLDAVTQTRAALCASITDCSPVSRSVERMQSVQSYEQQVKALLANDTNALAAVYSQYSSFLNGAFSDLKAVGSIYNTEMR